MRFIGITGGVGAGKSEILGYLAKKPDTRVMLADEIAHELMSPGAECYDRICEARRIYSSRMSDGTGENLRQSFFPMTRSAGR